MLRNQSYSIFEVRKFDPTVLNLWNVQRKAAGLSSPDPDTPQAKGEGCKRGKNRRPTAEGHRQRAERAYVHQSCRPSSDHHLPPTVPVVRG